jgi:hypothetical protein
MRGQFGYQLGNSWRRITTATHEQQASGSVLGNQVPGDHAAQPTGTADDQGRTVPLWNRRVLRGHVTYEARGMCHAVPDLDVRLA